MLLLSLMGFLTVGVTLIQVPENVPVGDISRNNRGVDKKTKLFFKSLQLTVVSAEDILSSFFPILRTSSSQPIAMLNN